MIFTDPLNRAHLFNSKYYILIYYNFQNKCIFKITYRTSLFAFPPTFQYH